MQMSVKYRFAFLCNPKCGSTSVEKAIAPFCDTGFSGHPSLKHLNATKYKAHIRPLLHKVILQGEIETFCIMREPVERLYSWYQYQARRVLRKSSHRAHQRYTGNISFEKFVEGFLSTPQPDYAKIGMQTNFIRLPNGEIGVDRIFRLDQMDAVGKFLSDKIGQQIVIEHRNKSSGKPQSKKALKALAKKGGSEPMAITDSLLARLKEHLSADYELYNSLRGDSTE